MTCGWAFDAFPQTRSGSEALAYPPRPRWARYLPVYCGRQRRRHGPRHSGATTRRSFLTRIAVFSRYIPVWKYPRTMHAIIHTSLANRTHIITPPERIPGTPILMSRPRHRQEGGPPCDFTGLPVRLDYPRGSRGPGIGRERKGSTFLGRSDMSDQNASRRDNLQASAGTRTRLGVRRLRDENPVGPPTAARYAAKS